MKLGFSMSKGCILANFDKNQVIRSEDIMHLLKPHANISADTDADGIGNKVLSSQPYLSLGIYESSYIVFLIWSSNASK